MAEDDSLQERLGYAFRDPDLLRLALTHPSLAHEQGAGVQHNQRLEFLGDAVLQLVFSAELYARFPEVSEGVLTKARAELVNRRTLARQARRLELGRNLLLSRGEESTGGRQRTSTLADAFEAVVGAIYLDGGLEAGRAFALRVFRELVGEIEVIPSLDNPKGELQERLQARAAEAPQYRVEAASGPDHERFFECAVLHQGVELGRGTGPSKKAAESEAARAALDRLRAAEPPATASAAGEDHCGPRPSAA